LVVIGLVLNALFIAMLGAANSYYLVVVALMLMGASNALAQVAASAIQVVAGRRAGMGTVLGLGSAGNGLGIVLGSVVGGLLLDRFNIGAPFYFGAVAIVIGAVVFLWLTRNEPTNEPLALPQGDLLREA
jgi:predicted MFS family arabinose efflux permease